MNNFIKYNFIIRTFIQVLYEFRIRKVFNLLRIKNLDSIVSKIKAITKAKIVIVIIYFIIIKSVTVENDSIIFFVRELISRQVVTFTKIILFVKSLRVVIFIKSSIFVKKTIFFIRETLSLKIVIFVKSSIFVEEITFFIKETLSFKVVIFIKSSIFVEETMFFVKKNSSNETFREYDTRFISRVVVINEYRPFYIDVKNVIVFAFFKTKEVYNARH